MKPNDVLDYYRTQEAVADALDIAQASISKWITNGHVPHLRQLQLERHSGGALKADAGILPRRSKNNSSQRRKSKD